MAFICSLPEWGLIRASGADAQTFLHGQLTNDLLHLDADAAQWSGYCTAKGRMLAGFLLWHDGAEGYFLATHRALIAALVKRLSMYVLRAKVRIEDASAQFAAFGLLDGPEQPSMRASALDGSMRIGLPAVDATTRSLAWVPAGDAPMYGAAIGFSPADASEWTRFMVRAGEAWITPATQEQFVPQMVNFDVLGGISFKKGCYPGQEIVARAHYRGAVKRRMYRASLDAPAKPGDALFASDLNGQESGVVALAAPDGTGGSEILAVLQIQSHDNAAVRLGSAEGPLLRFTALPYAFPDAA